MSLDVRPRVPGLPAPVHPGSRGANPYGEATARRPVLEAGVADHGSVAHAPTAALSSAPPAGTDPALWSVLTAEERMYFARAQAAGPVTYGPRNAHAARGHESLRGGRVDVRV